MGSKCFVNGKNKNQVMSVAYENKNEKTSTLKSASTSINKQSNDSKLDMNKESNELNSLKKQDLGEKTASVKLNKEKHYLDETCRTKKKNSSVLGQSEFQIQPITKQLLGKIITRDKIDLSKIATLDDENLRYLEILGEGGFGIVRKVYNIQNDSFFAIKYFKMNLEENLESITQDIAKEDFILEKIQSLNNPIFLKYLGLMRDPKSENNLVVVMESGEATLGHLIKLGLKFNQNELLFILNDIVNQLAFLQKNGICNRDIKPDNFIIVKELNNSFKFKVSDFGIGCLIETKDTYQIEIKDFSTCTPKFASPEALQMFDDEYEEENSYDPFLSDVYSLGKSLQIMMEPSQEFTEINELIKMMLIEQPKNRIDFFELQKRLEQPNYKTLMKVPRIEEYLGHWRNNKDKDMSLKQKLSKSLENMKLYNDIAHYAELEEYANIIEKLIEENNSELTKDRQYDRIMIQIYNQIATFYKEKKQKYDQAEVLFEKSINLCKKLYGEEDEKIASLFNNIASFYEHIRQDFDKAEEYYEKSLIIKKKVLGEDSLSTAISYNNLALLYEGAKKNYEKAEEYYEKSINIRKNLLGERNIATAISYNNFAIFYDRIKKNYDKAEEYYEKSLNIRRQVMGEHHPKTATSYNNLAAFYKNARMNYEKADECYGKSLQIFIATMGEQNPTTATTLLNYGIFLLDAKKEIERGEELIKKAYEIFKNSYGETHNNTKVAFSWLHRE